MNTAQLIEICHNTAKEKGFWDKERNMQEAFALILSELYEAFEAHRKGKFANLEQYNEVLIAKNKFHKTELDFIESDFKFYIKDTVQDELADVLIRIFDFCGGFRVQLAEYNSKQVKQNKSQFSENLGENILIITTDVTSEYYIEGFKKAIETFFNYTMYLCQELNIDIETHINLKLAYNATRAKLHGKNY